MAYSKTNWVNNTTPINETNLNKIEQGIYDNSLVVDAITNTLNPTDTETYKTAELTEGQITDVIGVNDIILKGNTTQDGTPTPENPVNIRVVTGKQEIKVYGKNMLDSSKVVTDTRNGITLSYAKDIFTINGTCTKDNTLFELYDTYQIHDKTTKFIAYYISGSVNAKAVVFRLYQQDYSSGISLNLTNLSNTNKSIMQIAPTDFVAHSGQNSLRINNGTTANNFKFKLMLTDSDDTEWEPYQGSTYPLSLGNIELCKIGDYQDYFYKSGSKWYLHKEINKITSYNGETITTSYISTTGELSTGAKVYYVVTPTDTKITDTTLISQLEAIYNAPLYEETNITQTNNDLPMVLDITAYKDNIKGIKAFLRK